MVSLLGRLVAASVALGLLWPGGAQAAQTGVALGGDFYGDNQIADTAASGARWARVFLYWADVASAGRGEYNNEQLRAYRTAVADLHARGKKVLIVVTGAPRYAADTGGLGASPRDPVDFADFMEDMTRQIPGTDAWELWNEPDSGAYWSGGPDPAKYAELLRAAYPRIKRFAPKAIVVMGGLTGNDYPFLEQVYAAGGKGFFDVVSAHTDTACNVTAPGEYLREPDGRISRYSFLGYRSVHDVMASNGDGALPIWLTEMGWSTSTAVCDRGAYAGAKAGGVSEGQQADFLAQAYHCLAEDPYVEVAMWFSLRDYTHADIPDHRHGLLNFDGLPKPSWSSFKDISRRGDTRTGPCGDFAGPEITVTSPAANARFASALNVSAAAADPSGVVALVAVDDASRADVVRQVDFAAPGSLVAATTWTPAVPDGPRTVRFVAVDRLGNFSTTAVPVVRAPDAVATAVTATVTGRGPRRAFTATVGPAPPEGLLRAVFEKRRGTRWVAGRRFSGPATGALRGTVTLSPGRWRLRARFTGGGVFSPSQAAPVAVAVSAPG